MITNPKTLKIKEDLDNLYQEILDSLDLEELLAHFRLELQIQKDFLKFDPQLAMSTEKIKIFENAIKQFEAVYEAEKAEAAKMPLSWHEANSVRQLFEDLSDDFNALPNAPLNH